jgi:hypothetical protein
MSARKIERQDLTTRSLLQNAKREDPIVLTFAHLFPFLDDSGCIFPVVDDSGAFPLFLDLSGLVLPVLDVGRASLVGLPRLDKSLHSSLKSRCLSAVSSINCANCNYFAFFLRLTTSLPFRKFEMGSGFGAHFSSAPLASAHPESQKSEIRPLEAVVNSLRQELQIKDWIMRKRLEDEFCLRSLLYAEMASMQSRYLCDARWSVRVHSHSATSQAASTEGQNTCLGDPLLVDPYLSATGSQGAYYFGLLNRFFASYANDLGISREEFIATATHPHFPKGNLHVLYTLGLGEQQLYHIGVVQRDISGRGSQDPLWQAQRITDRLVLAMSDRESVKQILLPLIVQQFYLLVNVSSFAAAGTE